MLSGRVGAGSSAGWISLVSPLGAGQCAFGDKVIGAAAELVRGDSNSMGSYRRVLAPQLVATVCYMDSVTHRQMRNDSADVLRRVAAGESLIITNSGKAAAVIGPVGRAPLDEVAASGQLRAATKDVQELRSIRRRRARLTSTEIIADSRSQW